MIIADYNDLREGMYYCMYADVSSKVFDFNRSYFIHTVNIIKTEDLSENASVDLVRLYTGIASATKHNSDNITTLFFEGAELVDFRKDTMEKFVYWELNEDEVTKHLLMETV
jgi:hypothetical protein